MQPPKFFSVIENYALFQPVGELTKEQAIGSVDEAVLYCRENGIGGLVADITRATGLPKPSVAEVFLFITKWAATAQGEVAVAMVAPPQMITTDKIGIIVAMNRGMQSEIFNSEAEAVKWIKSVLST